MEDKIIEEFHKRFSSVIDPDARGHNGIIEEFLIKSLSEYKESILAENAFKVIKQGEESYRVGRKSIKEDILEKIEGITTISISGEIKHQEYMKNKIKSLIKEL